MALAPIAYIAPNYSDYSTWWLKAYEPGTPTPLPGGMALDSAGATTVAKLQLNIDGFLVSAGGDLVIPYIDGAYDLWLFPNENDADNNITTNALRVADDITGVSPISESSGSITTNFDELDDVINSTDIDMVYNGAVLRIKDRANSIFDVVLVSGVTPDGKEIVALVGIPTLAVVLRGHGMLDNAAQGSPETGPLNTIACVVRITKQPVGVDNEFNLLDDVDHDPVNSVSVTGDLQVITVNHEPPQGLGVVGSTVVVPDETFALRGIMMGASVNTTQTVITLTKKHQFKMNWQAGAADIATLVEDPFMDTTQRYFPTDNTGGNGDYRMIMPRTLEGYRVITPENRASPDAYVQDVTDTTADFWPYKTVTFKCIFNAGVWTIESGQSVVTNGLIALGVTCSGVGTAFTLTHPPTLGDDANSQLTSGDVVAPYFMRKISETNTTVVISFINAAGAAVAPTNGDYFNVTLSDILWKYGRSIVDIGIIKCSPTWDFKDIGVANNIWLLGNHWALKKQ